MLGFAESLWVVGLARLLGGLMAGNISTAQAYVMDITSEKDRAKGMGLIGAGFGLGFIIGPALGRIIGTLVTGSLFAHLHIQSPYAITVAVMLCVFFIARSVQSHWERHNP